MQVFNGQYYHYTIIIIEYKINEEGKQTVDQYQTAREKKSQMHETDWVFLNSDKHVLKNWAY